MAIKVTKMPLSWYLGESVDEVYNADGSVTFVFEELDGRTGGTTISKEEYERAKADPTYLI